MNVPQSAEESRVCFPHNYKMFDAIILTRTLMRYRPGEDISIRQIINVGSSFLIKLCAGKLLLISMTLKTYLGL